MQRLLVLVSLLFFLAPTGKAQTAPDGAELTKLLNDFLAATNDPAMHERFWADDLIYTRSAGLRVNKAQVLHDVRSALTANPGDAKTTYSAEDVRIQQYGNTAIVAFRLVGTTTTPTRTQISKFLNSGTFLKRNGKWQVVNWQATRIPRVEEESKKELNAAVGDFFQSILRADVKQLTSLTDPSFIWTHSDGHQVNRPELAASLINATLKYSKLEVGKLTISVYGDTAIVRGESLRQRTSIPGAPGQVDASPFVAFYTLTFVNEGTSWRAVAMHTSRKTN